LAFSFRDIPQQHEYCIEKQGDGYFEVEKVEQTFGFLIAFSDTVASSVVESVKTLNEAGVTIRMVTADNPEISKDIALKTGIISAQDKLEESCKTGQEFDQLVGPLVCYYC
jgi:magnesium-transporting ATPase (P-type)